LAKRPAGIALLVVGIAPTPKSIILKKPGITLLTPELGFPNDFSVLDSEGV
jgi:hypothetical protein